MDCRLSLWAGALSHGVGAEEHFGQGSSYQPINLVDGWI